jgi:hypothetical protein
MTGMRDHDVSAVAAILKNTYGPGREAHIVLFLEARGAFAATNPRVDNSRIACRDALCLRTVFRNSTDDFMPQNNW